MIAGELGPLARTWNLEGTFARRAARIEGINQPAPKDQDRVGVGPDCLVVADGVTPLQPGEGARVQAFTESVIATCLAGGGEPLEEILRRAATATPGEAGEVPACALAAARVIGHTLELSSVADSIAAARCRDGRVFVCMDERNGPVEARTITRFYRAVLDGVTPEEARREIREDMREGRAGRNQPGSYWVVADDPAVAEEAEVLRLPLDEIETVLVASDGFTRAWEVLGVLGGLEEAFDPDLDLQQVITEIRTAELWRDRSPLPLFAGGDDISVLRMRLGGS